MKYLIFVQLLSILVGASFAHAKETVCTITINSTQEREIFKSKLNPAEFDFVELTDYVASKENTTGWFTRACEAKVRCDVLVISGHFGGSFFGSTKLSLTLNELEKQSCDQRCTGVLGQLKEAYLMGCNTLAGKSRDGRTPVEYLAALTRDGIEHTEAERIVASRYGPFGSSFGDRMERILEDARVIYGFSSVGPSGANVKKSLGSFLDKLGNYKTHLERLDVPKARSEWQVAMKAYNRASGVGLTKANPAYVIKENLCRLNDDDRSKSERIQMSQDLLDQNALLYLPTVANFLNNQVRPDGFRPGAWLDKAGQKSLLTLRRRTDLARTFVEARHSDGITPTIRMDLLKAERNVGWLSAWEYAIEVRSLFDTFTANPDVSGGDFICSQLDEDEELRKFVNINHIRGYAFNKAEQFKLAHCVKAKDPAITAKALDGFERNRAALTKGGIENAIKTLYPLSELRGGRERMAAVFRPYLKYRGNLQEKFRPFVLNILMRSTKGAELIQHLQSVFSESKRDDDPVNWASNSLEDNPDRSDESVKFVLNKYFESQAPNVSMYANFLVNSPPLLDWLADRIRTAPIAKVQGLTRVLERLNKFDSPALKDAAFEALIRMSKVSGAQKESKDAATGLYDLVFAIAKIPLSADQLKRLQVAYREADPNNMAHLRGLLYNRGRGVIELDESVIKELKYWRDCETEDSYSCYYRSYYQ